MVEQFDYCLLDSCFQLQSSSERDFTVYTFKVKVLISIHFIQCR